MPSDRNKNRNRDQNRKKMEFKIFGREVKTTKKSLATLATVLVLYILFLIWVGSWMGTFVIPFIIDNYTTRFIPWGWWKKSDNALLKKVMSWVDAIVFALIAVYFVHLYLFQNYVIPTSSLEKSLLVGDYLFVSKFNYGPRKPQTPLSMPLTQHTMPVIGGKSYSEAIQWDYERVPGLEDVKFGDIVVFNYPAGDVATTNPNVIDLHSICYAIGSELDPDNTPRQHAGIRGMGSLCKTIRARHGLYKGTPRVLWRSSAPPCRQTRKLCKALCGITRQHLADKGQDTVH